jgi:AmiR/NasT family two-component response regulator
MTRDESSERLESQVEELYRRIDLADAERRSLMERVNEADARADVSREMILDLQADGVVSEQHTRDLEAALKSSRTIGAAIGILMESRSITADEGLAMLKQASQDSNRKLREIAAEIVALADPAT